MVASNDRRPFRVVLRVPAGIAVGRVAWGAFASNLGVPSVLVIGTPAIVLVAAGTLLIAYVLAIGPAVVASRSRPANLLKAE